MNGCKECIENPTHSILLNRLGTLSSIESKQFCETHALMTWYMIGGEKILPNKKSIEEEQEKFVHLADRTSSIE